MTEPPHRWRRLRARDVPEGPRLPRPNRRRELRLASLTGGAFVVIGFAQLVAAVVLAWVAVAVMVAITILLERLYRWVFGE